MTTAIDRARVASQKAQWAHVARACCDYGPPILNDRPYRYGREGTALANDRARRRRGGSVAVLSIAVLTVLASALGVI